MAVKFEAFLVVSMILSMPSTSSPQSPLSFFGWPLTSESRQEQESTTINPLLVTPVADQGMRGPPVFQETPAVSAPLQFTELNLSRNLTGSGNQASLNGSALSTPFNTTSPLVSYLGAEVSSFITTIIVFLGAALGRTGCDLKAACLAGTLVPPIQGRDLAMVAAEPLVPEEWKAFYLAAKSSMIQGQDCNRFNCF